MKKIRTVLLFFNLFILYFNVFSYEVYVEEQNIFLDIPETWYALEVRTGKTTIADPTDTAFFIVRKYGNEKGSTLSELYANVMDELGAQGEAAEFYYKKNPSYFAEINFQSEGFDFTGFGLFIKEPEISYVLLAFSDIENIQYYTDYLLSIMDSFMETEDDFLNPGPVSMFMSSLSSDAGEKKEIFINDKKFYYMYSPLEIDTAQWVAEREMRVLESYTGSEYMIDAWKRSYRMIYRDSFKLTRNMYTQLAANIIPEDSSDLEIAVLLLKWLQTFDYSRTGDIADFQNPAACLINNEGDCDSLAMLYIMLLKRFGIDSVLFISHVYSHAMAGVAVDVNGASMNFEGTRFVVAEMTADVDIGLIDQEFSDINGWITVDFH